MRSEAMRLLLDAARAHPRGMAGVSEVLGYSRPALSRYVHGSYGEGSRLEVRIIERLQGVRHCPHDREDIALAACVRRAHSPKPYGGEARLAAWQSCQRCPARPPQPTSTED